MWRHTSSVNKDKQIHPGRRHERCSQSKQLSLLSQRVWGEIAWGEIAVTSLMGMRTTAVAICALALVGSMGFVPATRRVMPHPFRASSQQSTIVAAPCRVKARARSLGAAAPLPPLSVFGVVSSSLKLAWRLAAVFIVARGFISALELPPA